MTLIKQKIFPEHSQEILFLNSLTIVTISNPPLFSDVDFWPPHKASPISQQKQW